ncbi:MAG: sulfatase [Planctomycetota bacterium]|nr:sulfatase [Planctomycetota bacterium]
MRILFLDIDTLRADHLRCYGYHRNTSPTIDSIAAEGVRFENYYCSDAPCLPSRAALMTGRFGIHTGVVGHGDTAADMRIQGRGRGFRDRLAVESLPAVLKSAGFRTVTISPFAERHSAWWFYAGFREAHDTGRHGMESAEEITPAVIEWLESNARRDNWFLHVNYWDPHTPYRALADFGNPFENDPLPAWLTGDVLQKHLQAVGPHTAREINMYDNAENPRYPRHPGEILDMRGLRRMIDGYDCGIRYVDGHVRMILDVLEKAGVMHDTAIIVSSDHGENQGELAIYGEHATADHPTCRIPMIIRWPGARRGHVDRGLHYNLDLLPTLAGILGKKPSLRWDGRSFAPALFEGRDCGREYLVLSQCAHVCQRSVRFGRWLYMRTYHDGFHLFPKEMLFDLEADPHEEKDLAVERPDLCREAVYRLAEWHDRAMAAAGWEPDPMWTVLKEGGPYHARGHLRAYCERLAATGRGWAVEELKRRHPDEFQ